MAVFPTFWLSLRLKQITITVKRDYRQNYLSPVLGFQQRYHIDSMEIIWDSPCKSLLAVEISMMKNYYWIQLLLLLLDNNRPFINIVKLSFTAKNVTFWILLFFFITFLAPHKNLWVSKYLKKSNILRYAQCKQLCAPRSNWPKQERERVTW